jgi:hypothetical protein
MSMSDTLIIQHQFGIIQNLQTKEVQSIIWISLLQTSPIPQTSFLVGTFFPFLTAKVIIEKSRGEGSLMEQDTIENVS